jgi:hypothetical protein
MKSLRALQDEWVNFPLELYDAAPFLAYRPEGYFHHAKRILYVGKATNKECWRDQFEEERGQPAAQRIQSQLDREKVFFESQRNRNGRSFWGFANTLSHSAARSCDARPSEHYRTGIYHGVYSGSFRRFMSAMCRISFVTAM